MGMDPIEKNQSCELLIDENPLLSKSELNLTWLKSIPLVLGKIDFKTTLIPYRVNTSWIEDKLTEMKGVLNSDSIPKMEKTCEKCAYLKGGKEF